MLATDLCHEWWQERPTPDRLAPLKYWHGVDLALLSAVAKHLLAKSREKSQASSSSSAAAQYAVLVYDACEISLEAGLFLQHWPTIKRLRQCFHEELRMTHVF